MIAKLHREECLISLAVDVRHPSGMGKLWKLVQKETKIELNLQEAVMS